MKKLTLLLCLLLMIGMLCACGNDTEDPTNPSNNQVTDPTNGPTNGPTDGPTGPTIPPTTPPTDAPGNPTYKVTILDQDGNPVAGALVQFCDEESCKMPVKTGEDGTVIVSNYPESKYHLTITKPGASAPEATEYYFEDGSTEITITLEN